MGGIQASTGPPARDSATRQRLFDAGTRLFGEHGFKRVTVRQLAAAAGANVAAVNYHFGDKAGLYGAIVDSAIRTMQETGALAREAGRGREPQDQLHAYVTVFLTRVSAAGTMPWIHRLVTREMDEPTDAMARIVREVLEPRNAYLGGIFEALTGLPAADPRVVRTLASIHGQIFLFGRPVSPKMPARWRHILRDIDAAADHITTFSLGGMRAVANLEPSPARRNAGRFAGGGPRRAAAARKTKPGAS